MNLWINKNITSITFSQNLLLLLWSSMIAASPFALLHGLSPPSAAFVRKISSKGAKIECLLDVWELEVHINSLQELDEIILNKVLDVRWPSPELCDFRFKKKSYSSFIYFSNHLPLFFFFRWRGAAVQLKLETLCTIFSMWKNSIILR